MDFKLSKIRREAKQYSYENERTRVRFLALIELCKRCEQDRTRVREVVAPIFPCPTVFV